MKKSQLIGFALAASLSTVALAETERDAKETTSACEEALCEGMQAFVSTPEHPTPDEWVIPDPRAAMTPTQMVDDKVRRLLGPGKYIPSTLWKWTCSSRNRAE